MTRHVLGTIHSDVDPDAPSRKHHTLDIFSELTEEEYSELSEAQNTLSSFLHDSQMFMMVAWNFNELVAQIATYAQSYAGKQPEIFTIRPIYINLNRAFLNLLASVRSYLDFMDRSLKARFGQDSDIAVSFGKKCSREYDENFSYRFLYRLRNYAQHKGFPIGRITWGQRESQLDPMKPEIFLDLFIVRDQILADFDWGPVEPEVKALPELIDLAPHTVAFMDSLSAIHLQAIRDLFHTLEESARQVVAFGGRIAGRPGQPVIFELEDEAKETLRNISHQPLLLELANRITTGQLEAVIRRPG
jgi:hypothetical protein